MKFELYELDMWRTLDGDWEENDRHRLGIIDIDVKTIDEINEFKLLDAVYRFKVRGVLGLTAPAISTTDRRRVYAEDPYGDGHWFEVGAKKEHQPLYGLLLVDEEKTEMKQWRIPVQWEVCAMLKVNAYTLEEAMEIARDDDGIIPLPTDNDYIDGSWSLSESDVDVIRNLYNDCQEDSAKKEGDNSDEQ